MPSPASPGTNQYHCDACGRYFNEETELRDHQRDCLAAKQSGKPVNPAKPARDEGDDREWVSVP